ncbi:MAG: RIO1 family regulatory kinase/ATPase domain-containing protein [Promethearchaeota archaeon]
MEKEEFRVLNAIEISMRKFEWVPFLNIVFYTRYDEEEVRHWLDLVHKKGLLIRNRGKRETYVLNSKGYDLLALRALRERNVVKAIGNSLGVGKESDVYQGLAPDGTRLALKFHRIGRTSFRAIKLKRNYVEKRKHVSWLYLSRLSAAREAKHLELLQDLGIAVPRLISYNRHVVVLKQYEGQEIHEFPTLDDPEIIFDEIIENVRQIYSKAKLVHSDLGEFNIIYTSNHELLIIDWPQAIPITHPNAKRFLRRDIENICNFFKRKHGIYRDADEIIKDIVKD